MCSLADARWLSDTPCLPTFATLAACDEHRRRKTWLASYPGSGNSWARIVLELATRVRTGSVYDVDGALLRAGLLGEAHTAASEVIVVKTHYPVTFGWEVVSMSRGGEGDPSVDLAPAIVLVRHPLRAALSHVANQNFGHSAEVAPAELRPAWLRDRERHLSDWRRHVEYWRAHGGSTAWVRYEDVVRDVTRPYRDIVLPFLGINVSDAVLARLRCAAGASALPETARAHSEAFKFGRDDRRLLSRIVGDALLARFGYNNGTS
jgi:hypothetical protein